MPNEPLSPQNPEASNEPETPKKAKHVVEWGFLEKEIPTFYINQVQFGVSDMDMRIDLGEIQRVTRSEDGTITTQATPRVRLFFSLVFAQRFLNSMQRHLASHKKNVLASAQQVLPQIEKAISDAQKMVDVNKKPE